MWYRALCQLMTMLKTFPPKKTSQIDPTSLKKQFTMSQKSCYRKWVNKVGDLKTCTEKLNTRNRKMWKKIMTPDLMDLAGGWGGLSLCNTLYIISGGPKKNAPTLVIFKNTRYVIYVTCLSMVGKRNSLAFYPFPTFVITTTSMDTIPKTVPVVTLK